MSETAVGSEATEATEAADSTAAPARSPDLSPAACGARLAELFPALFGPGGPAKPIKLRIQADLQLRAPGVFTKRSLGLFLSRHTTTTAYLKALTQSPHRFDLDGQPAGEIDDIHRSAAATELARRREMHEARRAAERAAQRGQRPPRAAPAGMPAEPGAEGAAPASSDPSVTPAEGPARTDQAPRPPRPPRPPGAPRGDRAGDPRRGPSAARDGRPMRPEGDRPPGPAGDRPSGHAGDRPPGPTGDRPPRPGRPPQGGPGDRVARPDARPGSSDPHRPGRRDPNRDPQRPGRRDDPRDATRDGPRPDRRGPGDARDARGGHDAPRESAPPVEARLEFADPAQRERAQLLRQFDSSPLTKANFCVLKRMSEADLDAILAQARAERGPVAPPRPAMPRQDNRQDNRQDARQDGRPGPRRPR